MTRIPFPTIENMTAEQRRVYDEITAGPRQRLVGVLRAALHQPELADLWQKFGAFVRFRTSVPSRLSELAILVTARRWTSQVEWYVHAESARGAGLSEDVIQALLRAESPVFEDAGDAAVYEFARELQETGRVSPAVYGQVLSELGTVGVVELAAIVGYYTMVSMTLNAHEMPMPDGAAPPLAPLPAEPGDNRPSLTKLSPSRLADPAAVVKKS